MNKFNFLYNNFNGKFNVLATIYLFYFNFHIEELYISLILIRYIKNKIRYEELKIFSHHVKVS